LETVEKAADFRGRPGVEVIEPLKVTSRAATWFDAWNQIWPRA